MGVNFTPPQEPYKEYKTFDVFFKSFVLQNFPLIEEDFDSLTYYQMLCKIVGYMKDVIDNNKAIQDNQEAVLEAYNELQNYVNHYFDNLDVQEEINNKLDEMVESGSLQSIIISYLNSTKILIVIGDSYSKHQYDDITKFWWESFGENLGLTLNTNFFVKAVDGAGFYNGNFLNALTSVVNSLSTSQKQLVGDILIVGGYNDRGHPNEVVSAMQTFNTYAKTNLPNTKISLAFVSKENPYITNSSQVNVIQLPRIKRKYIEGANKCGWRYLVNTEYILHNYDTSYWQEDGVHPSQLGQNQLANYMTTAFLTGSINVTNDYGSSYLDITPSGIATNYNNAHFTSGFNNNMAYLKKGGFNQYIQIDNTTPLNLNGNNSFEIGTLKSNFMSGYGSGASQVSTVWFSGRIGESQTTVRIPVLCTFYLEYGKLYIRPLVFYENQSISSMYVDYIFYNNLKIIDDTELC